MDFRKKSFESVYEIYIFTRTIHLEPIFKKRKMIMKRIIKNSFVIIYINVTKHKNLIANYYYKKRKIGEVLVSCKKRVGRVKGVCPEGRIMQCTEIVFSSWVSMTKWHKGFLI